MNELIVGQQQELLNMLKSDDVESKILALSIVDSSSGTWCWISVDDPYGFYGYKISFYRYVHIVAYSLYKRLSFEMPDHPAIKLITKMIKYHDKTF